MKQQLKKYNLKYARKNLPQKRKTDNKSSGGKSYLVAGSKGMFGAGVLAAAAAARIGSGYVTLVTDTKSFPSHKNPDFLLTDWKTLWHKKQQISALGIGPGLGKSKRALTILRQLLKSPIPNVIVDADALNLCAQYNLAPFPQTWIATPHEGELARLLGETAEHIRKNRLTAVIRAQQKLKCVVVLKGHHTLIADSTRIYQIESGNAALAKAGTGDVLTGMITGLVAQGLPSMQASGLGAFVHGWLADQWIKDKNDPLSLMASDLLERLPKALARIRSGEN